MFRAEILAEGVRDELPHPLVNAAQGHKRISEHVSADFQFQNV